MSYTAATYERRRATFLNNFILATGKLYYTKATSAGSGYTNGNHTLTCSGGGASTNASFTITVASGSITKVKMISRGAGYTSTPSFPIPGTMGAGTGAVFSTQLSQNCTILGNTTNENAALQACLDNGINSIHIYDLNSLAWGTSGVGTTAAPGLQALANFIKKARVTYGILDVSACQSGSATTVNQVVSYNGGRVDVQEKFNWFTVEYEWWNAAITFAAFMTNLQYCYAQCSAVGILVDVYIGWPADLTITNKGSGYTSTPSVNITGGSPSVAATAVAVVETNVSSPDYRKVVAVNFTNQGSGYSSPPTITITGGGGTGATVGTPSLIAGHVAKEIQRLIPYVDRLQIHCYRLTTSDVYAYGRTRLLDFAQGCAWLNVVKKVFPIFSSESTLNPINADYDFMGIWYQTHDVYQPYSVWALQASPANSSYNSETNANIRDFVVIDGQIIFSLGLLRAANPPAPPSTGVTPIPIITVGGPTTFCAPSTLLLTATGAVYLTYQWYLNGVAISGATASTYSPTYSTVATRVITVVVTDVNGTATSAGTTLVAVLAPTSANATITPSGSLNICTGNSVTFSLGSTVGMTVQWYKDNIAIVGATGTTYVASTSGVYKALLTNTCGSIFSPNPQTLVVSSLPIKTCSSIGPSSVCSPSTVTVVIDQPLGVGETVAEWRTSGGTPIPGTAGLTSIVVSSTMPVYCVIQNACGYPITNFLQINVESLPTSVIAASGPLTFCQGSSVALFNSSSAASYQWKLNSVNIPGATSSTFTATSSGSYTCLTTTSCGSTLSNTIVVVVNSLPVVNLTLSGSPTICTGSTVVLNAQTGSGYSFQWYRNGSAIGGATASTYVASLSGTYHYVVTNACGSTNSSLVVITVNSLPIASVTPQGPTTFCQGSFVNLQAIFSPSNTYQWKKDGVNISGAVSPAYSAYTSGSYQCVVTNSCGNSTSSAVVVTVNSLPTVSIAASGPTTFLQGFNVILTATSLATNFYWSTGETTQSITVGSSGDYWCIVGDSNGCTSLASNAINITVTPLDPVVEDPNAETSSFRSADNVGLPFRFTLNETNAFRLIGGEVKCQDNVWGMIRFSDHYRTYYQDFCPNVLVMLQKPTSYIESFKVLVLGRIQKSMGKYLTFITCRGINIEYDYLNRKALGIGIDYSYKLAPTNTYRIITFIKS